MVDIRFYFTSTSIVAKYISEPKSVRFKYKKPKILNRTNCIPRKYQYIIESTRYEKSEMFKWSISYVDLNIVAVNDFDNRFQLPGLKGSFKYKDAQECDTHASDLLKEILSKMPIGGFIDYIYTLKESSYNSGRLDVQSSMKDLLGLK